MDDKAVQKKLNKNNWIESLRYKKPNNPMEEVEEENKSEYSMSLTLDSEWLEILKATHEATPLGFQPTTLPLLKIDKNQCSFFEDIIPAPFMHAT